SAIGSAERDGLISTDVADDLLDEVNLKIDRVQSGETTVSRMREEEGYEEFWRRRARERGLFEENGDAEDPEE
ncbi:MAG: CPA1 family monovalent cation:H+ antiporter, partial [Natronomonas sp.]